MNNKERFRKLLNYLFENMSKNDLAGKLGVSVDTINRWAKGTQHPSVHLIGETMETLRKISGALRHRISCFDAELREWEKRSVSNE